ncbi:MAG: GNAT family N-acetyltransferase [Pseudomonadota bacterium]
MSSQQLEDYWNGILLVPERKLIVGRLENTIAASIQIVHNSNKYVPGSFACTVENHFVAPWARGYGIAKMLIKFAESLAAMNNLSVIKLSVRANQTSAINLYESMGFKKWGVLDKYEYINNKMYAGHFYYKDIIKDY